MAKRRNNREKKQLTQRELFLEGRAIVGGQFGGSVKNHHAYHFSPEGHIVAEFYHPNDQYSAQEAAKKAIAFVCALGFQQSELIARTARNEYNEKKIVVASSVLINAVPYEMRSKFTVHYQKELEKAASESKSSDEGVRGPVTEMMTPTTVITLGADDNYSLGTSDGLTELKLVG